MRYRLRTLLIVVAIGPLVLWAGWLLSGWLAESRDIGNEWEYRGKPPGARPIYL
jgi:hypothetical protein